jgi:hypothetical protein
MKRNDNLYLLVSHLLVLVPGLMIIALVRPPEERRPILLGWLVAALNYTLALSANLTAMKKSFDAFKLMVLGGSVLRMLIMLVLLFLVMHFKATWITPFSFSLLSCFGIYIILEVGFFFLKSKKIMS